MGFTEAVRVCFSKYVVFTGRAARPEYWWFALFVVLGSIVVGAIDALVFGYQPGDLSPFSSIFSLAILLPAVAVAFRRIHDTDRTAWWLLISLIPVIGTIVLIVFFCQKGTPGPNRFGSEPGAAWLASPRR